MSNTSSHRRMSVSFAKTQKRPKSTLSNFDLYEETIQVKPKKVEPKKNECKCAEHLRMLEERQKQI